jgi:hypothetical protein
MKKYFTLLYFTLLYFTLLSSVTLQAQEISLFTEIGSDAIALTHDEIKVIQFYQEKPTTNSVKLVRVAPNYNDFEQLRFRPIGQELQRVATKSSVTIEDEDIKDSWVGNLEHTDGGGHLILFDTPFGTMGSLMYGDKTIEITPLRADISIYVESNNENFPPDICISTPTDFGDGVLCEDQSNCNSVIDILAIIHTKAINALYPTSYTIKGPNSTPVIANSIYQKKIIKAKIQAEIAKTNLALLNSEIKNFTFRLVGVEYMDMVMSTDPDSQIALSKDHEDFIANPTAQNLRNQYKADIAVLISNQKYALVNGIGTSFPYPPNKAYAVIEARTLGTPAVTFLHEIGHMLGADHLKEDDPNSTDCAHAHAFSDGSRTILAYGINNSPLENA